MRDAPSIDIIEGLLRDGATVKAFDPAGFTEAKEIFKDKIEFFNDMYKVAEGCDALVVITEWNQFRNPDFEKLKSILKKPVLIDLRNVYERTKMESIGFHYTGVGR
jgi:UDPglucose 6-dehydrogenase